jgi:uncharacterized membrane protein
VATASTEKSRAPQGSGENSPRESEASFGLTPVLERNIRTLCRRRALEAATATWHERIADVITRFTGSMTFVYLHIAIFGCWIVANLGWIPGIRPWDETFVVLAMVASVEAIFLSTFVLITQNRMAAAADKRADLDLQISLLAEHEISKLAVLTSAIAKHLGVKSNADREVADAKQEVAPDKVLDKIEAVRR